MQHIKTLQKPLLLTLDFYIVVVTPDAFLQAGDDQSLCERACKMKGKSLLRKQHVHFKPEPYIGSFSEVHERTWIIENGKPILKNISYIPAVFKLCDELIVNAVQHKNRSSAAHVFEIIVRENGTIAVINNGTMSFQGTLPTPADIQAVFGEEQLGSELYKRGRGGKLVNMFSRCFFVQMGSKEKSNAVKVQWRDNMALAQQPRIVSYDQQDYTKVQATLDLQKFRLVKFSADFIALLERRAYDIAALNQVRVIFNERDIRFGSLSDYARLFTKGGAVHVEEEGGWRVAMGPSEHGFQQLSFVNDCFWTRNGGIHVNSVIAQIAAKGLQKHHKRLKDPNQILQSSHKFTSNYFLLVSATLQAPQFNSTQRDSLINPKMPTPFRISDTAMEFLNAQQALKAYSEMARQREQSKNKEENKKDVLGVVRLEDAQKAGMSSRCTLLLVENEATRYLMSIGLECVNREYFGIYTLQEKPPNVREIKNPMQHPDFLGITKALGLPTSSQNIQQLRYGNVLIVTDQDSQGVSTKGLLLNFFEVVFPWVLRTKGFIKMLVPPVVRCTNVIGNVRQFLSERDYRSWSSLNSVNEWTPTYFRTLGSMDPIHMRDLFADRKKYSFSIIYQSPLDEGALSLPYGLDTDARRKWLQDYRPQAYLDYNLNSKTVPIRQFVDRQLSHVLYAEATRSLPSALDGLTITQRNVLYSLLKLGEGQELQVNKLASLVLQQCREDNLEAVQKSILALGRNYVGSNNLPLIEAIGNFGSRMSGGKDHAPISHLRTSLCPMARLLFPTEDDELLTYPAQQSQPLHYLPILPTLLINGFSQAGPLWKSVVFPHTISSVIQAVRDMLMRKSLKGCLLPGWEGFKGQVEQKNNSFSIHGVYELKCTKVAIVKEIPPMQAIRDYRATLQGREEVEEVKQEQKGDSCMLVVRFKEGRAPRDLQHYLQLTHSLQQSPSVLITPASKPRKYISLANILEDYMEARLKLYQKRKEATLSKLSRSIEMANEKIRFIRDVLSGEFQLTDSEEAWRIKFIRKGYKRYQDLPKLVSTRPPIDPFRDFQYLERMHMSEFSERKIIQLRAERVQNEEKLAQVRKISEKEMWLREIAQFEDRWRKVTRQRQQITLESIRLAENGYKQQPSEPSLNNNKPAFEFDELSLDSKARAQLERSKTQGISQEDPAPKPKHNGITGQKKAKPQLKPKELTEKDNKKAEYEAQRKLFDMQIRQMEKKNIQFQDKLRREADAARREAERSRKQEIIDKQRIREAQRAKKEEQQQRLKQLREKEQKMAKDKANVQREANNRRELLGRHAMEIGKKVEQDQRRKQEEKERSEKSNRNHLPTANGILPKITVPYPCDSSTFQVNHVERKRFSSKNATIDQAEINRIHADIRRQDQINDQKANNNKNNTCIDLDEDD